MSWGFEPPLWAVAGALLCATCGSSSQEVQGGLYPDHTVAFSQSFPSFHFIIYKMATKELQGS